MPLNEINKAPYHCCAPVHDTVCIQLNHDAQRAQQFYDDETLDILNILVKRSQVTHLTNPTHDATLKLHNIDIISMDKLL